MRNMCLIAAASSLGLCLVAPRDALADAVDIELIAEVMRGQGKPALVLKINEPVERARIDLTRSDGAKIRRRQGPLRAGSEARFELEAPLGTTGFEGSLEVLFQNGNQGAIPLDFTVEVAAGFGIHVPRERLDLEKGRLELTLTRPAGHCEHEVVMEDKPVRRGTSQYKGEAPGTWLSVAWRPFGQDDLVLKIALVCWDRKKVFFTKLELYPWSIEIPHEDVNFDSGQATIKEREAFKLNAAYQAIDTAVARYGKWVEGVKLYVAGHTDTVADAAYNRELSMRRARSIANYFRRLGVQVPILYAGYGEDELLVVTKDNTDEPRNRRAEYNVAVEPPVPGSWKRLLPRP